MAKYYYEKWSLKWDLNSITWKSERSENSVGTTYRILIDGTTELVYKNNLNVDDLTFNNDEYQPGYYANNQPFYCLRITKLASNKIYYKAINSNISRTELLEYRIKNTLVENIVADESEYPLDGIQGDYWYVRGEKAFPSLKIKGIGNIGGAKIKDSNGVLKSVGNVYFKDSNGLVRNLK